MLKGRENSSESESKLGNNDNIDSQGKNLENPGDKTLENSQEKGMNTLRDISSEMVMGRDGLSGSSLSKGAEKISGSQELTLSYLCDNSKLGFLGKDILGKDLMNSDEKVCSYKGKEVVSEDQNEESNRWVERDFLKLNENCGNSSKRVAENVDFDLENREKKPKIEPLKLSLALPDVSLSLAGSKGLRNDEPSSGLDLQNGDPSSALGVMKGNSLSGLGVENGVPPSSLGVPNGDFPSRLRSSRSVQSLAPSMDNTHTTYSNDFTAASLSYSYSHPFSHNPSCSLTRNSTENYEYSVGSHRRGSDQIWNCGEGTNGSVHSRFRPLGDGSVAFSNHVGGGFAMGNHLANKDAGNNSIYRPAGSDNNSFFPSELPARPRLDAQSGDSRGRGSEGLRSMDNIDGGRARKLSRPERILREIVSESIPVMAQIIQELPDETVESTKEYLKNLISMPERKDELIGLQNRLERRSDLTNETLLKCHRIQLEIMVAIKMGLGSYLSGTNHLHTAGLVEVFLLERCRNLNCKRLLPVDDCECKICLTKKGFCSECMCPVCFNFDSASNTCNWVGCDACSHWCHAVCGIQKGLIKPGPSFKGPAGITEMQFHCLGCSHASEMFGFVKDVFRSCAKAWGDETLLKELACVKKIFQGSDDFKGKELHLKADELLSKLKSKSMSPADVCNFIFQFFDFTDGLSEFAASSIPPNSFTTSQPSFGKDVVTPLRSNSLTPTPFYNVTSSSGRKDRVPVDLRQADIKNTVMGDKLVEDEWSVKRPKKDGFDSLESVVLIKEAEARMFQNRADEARREAESFGRMIRMKFEKLEEEYADKLAKLCLQETEGRRKTKLEELKILENAQCDYHKMKMRMQSEIAGLLKRMETTKQLWA